MPINTELLERVKQHILEEPRRYDQETWGKQSDEAPCGTRACIAGWAAFLSGELNLKALRAKKADVRGIARRALGLSEDEAMTLFTGMPLCDCGERNCRYGWPYRFAKMYDKAETPQDRVSAAVAYLDHIITTGKVTE